MISTPSGGALSVISTSLSSNSPWRSFLRNSWRVVYWLSVALSLVLAGGSKTLRMRSSAASAALG